ncbi:ABC-type nitrate/sulfonate/bicarbonate transport system substrate-binding protein [Bradyrhizobium elkanii]
MQVSRTTVLRWILAGMIGLAEGVWPALAPLRASDLPPPLTIQFTLDRPLDAAAAPFVMASTGGLFSAEGLAVGTNVATSSADAIARVADGSSDFALVDINSLIRFRDKTGAAPVKAVFVLFNQAPYAIIARKSRGIRTLSDMQGKSLGVAEGDLSIRLWPAVAKQNGIKLSSVKQSTISAAVREPMLSAGQVDAVTGFSYLSAINLRDRGVPADDLAVLRFADYGCEAYGFAVIVSPRLAAAKPDAVKGFVRAAIGGTNLAVKDPARAAGRGREPDGWRLARSGAGAAERHHPRQHPDQRGEARRHRRHRGGALRALGRPARGGLQIPEAAARRRHLRRGFPAADRRPAGELRACECITDERHQMFSVVLAKARTHYPSRLLLRDAGATIPLSIKFGGYGSWLSPGRWRGEPLATITVTLRMTRSPAGPASRTLIKLHPA